MPVPVQLRQVVAFGIEQRRELVVFIVGLRHPDIADPWRSGNQLVAIRDPQRARLVTQRGSLLDEMSVLRLRFRDLL
jgi:hypothetical protein